MGQVPEGEEVDMIEPRQLKVGDRVVAGEYPATVTRIATDRGGDVERVYVQYDSRWRPFWCRMKWLRRSDIYWIDDEGGK